MAHSIAGHIKPQSHASLEHTEGAAEHKGFTIFPASDVYTGPVAEAVAEPEDSSLPIDTVYMQIPTPNPVHAAYVRDMCRYAQKYGFKAVLQCYPGLEPSSIGLHNALASYVTCTEGVFSPSDNIEKHHILIKNPLSGTCESLVSPGVPDDVLAEAELFTRTEGFHPHKPGFSTYYDVPYTHTPSRIHAEHPLYTCKPTDLCLDGDNLLTGVHPNGVPYAIVGRDSVVLSTLYLDKKGHFDKYGVRQLARTLQASKTYTVSDIRALASSLGRAKKIPPGWIAWFFGARYGSAPYEQALHFAAKLETTKKMISDALGIDLEHLYVVDQPDVHIDLHMHLMGSGHMVLNDPERCIEILDHLLEKPSLSEADKQQLKEMLEHAYATDAYLTPILRNIEKTLQEAGLTVSRFPGSFQSRSRRAHFLHGLAGQYGHHKTFYIADSSSVLPLQNAIKKCFHKELGIDSVDFIASERMEDGLTASEHALKKHRGLDAREIHTLRSKQPLPDLRATDA